MIGKGVRSTLVQRSRGPASMASATTQAQTLAGASACLSSLKPVNGVDSSPASLSPRCPGAYPRVLAMAPKKKVNAYDSEWKKSFFGFGYFAENTEDAPVDVVKKLEKKKILSGIEKAGLLSKAEKAGISLSKIEELGLLSKAESLGLLSLAESFATSSPAALASLSLPLLVGALLAPIVIPDDSTVLVVVQYTLAAALGVGGAGLFLGSILLGVLQEE